MDRRVATAAPWVLFALALLAGAWLRFDGLTGADLYGDEAEYALISASILEDPLRPSWSLDGERHTRFVSQPPLVLYLSAATEALLGDGWERHLVAAFGLAGVLAAFLLGREAYDAWSAAAAACFLAVAPMHVELSRTFFLDVPFATFTLLAAWALLRWLRLRTWTWAVAAGALTACAVLAKLPGVLVPGAFVVFLAAQALRERLAAGSWGAARVPGSVVGALGERRGALQAGAGAGVFLLLVAAYAALIVAAGYVDAWQSKMEWQAGRVTGEVTSGAAPWTVYVSGPDALPTRLGVGLFVLGAVGLAHAVARWLAPARAGPARPGDGLLVAWTLVAAAFFVLSARKVWFYPLPLVPGLMVLAGRTAAAVSRAAWSMRPGSHGRSRHVQRGILVAALVVLSVVQVATPAWSSSSAMKETGPVWGQGFGEACRTVADARVDDEGALATLLGRYALRNACPDLRVFDRFRSDLFTRRDVGQGEIRWLVQDPYYVDRADVRSSEALFEAFPHRTVATVEGLGTIGIVEFLPETLDVRIDRTLNPNGSSRLDITVANPPGGRPVDLTDRKLELTVYAGWPDWPYAVWKKSLTVRGDTVLAPGESRSLTYTWKGGTFWSAPEDLAAGTYVTDAVLAGAWGQSAPWTEPGR